MALAEIISVRFVKWRNRFGSTVSTCHPGKPVEQVIAYIFNTDTGQGLVAEPKQATLTHQP
jgi:hypothetical protein